MSESTATQTAATQAAAVGSSDWAQTPLIYEQSTPGACAADLPALDVPEADLPEQFAAEQGPALPEVGQLDLVRHYSRLASKAFSVDANFYPLGSCTMKYNPTINEAAAATPGMANCHPLQEDADVQGLLEVLYDVRAWLAEVAGLPAVSLQPCAGAHGEYTALKVIRAYFADPQGGNQPNRKTVLAPDTAHGTNPASCAMCGANVVTVPSKEGMVDLDQLRSMVDENTAALMITNPNTAGLFDGTIGDIADILHEAGAMLYLDGANMNAIVGVSRPGDFGVDAMHYNTHKTFSTPHGCGGPGSGPIAVTDVLEPYLPVPRVARDETGRFFLESDHPKSIGKVRSFFGQFGVLLRCWAYMAACGPDGLKNVAQSAVLNANYLGVKLKDRYPMPYFDPDNGKYCAHEFVTVPKNLLAEGVTLIDIAKRLIDFGVHPPTMHWPVHDCLMIEPTETESKATLDHFIAVMLQIADEVENQAEMVKAAPHHAPTSRMDEVQAARSPRITWQG